MFREMRRKDRQLSQEQAMEILEKSGSGVLAVNGDDGYPYTVPINHAMVDGKIIFHCAKTGHKIDAIKSSDKASYCVVENETVDFIKCTSYYKSVVAFGRIKILEDGEEKKRLFEALARRFSDEYTPQIIKKVEGGVTRIEILVFEIEHITAKEKLPVVPK